MFKNSTELLEYALRELQVAIRENKKEVEIALSNNVSRDVNEISKVNRRLEIGIVAALLRKVYTDYHIKSIIGPKLDSEIAVKLPQVPTVTYYPIVWKLSLQKK